MEHCGAFDEVRYCPASPSTITRMFAKLLPLLGSLLLWWTAGLLPGWAQQRAYVWAVSGGGTGYDSGNCVATDQAGNVYQAGLFRGTARFGQLTLTARTAMLDVFLAKYTPQGQVLWVRQISGDNIKSVQSLAVDAAGEAVVTGDYTTAQLPPTSSPTLTLDNVTLTGGSIYEEMYLARYDAQGQLLWATHSVGQGLAGTSCLGQDVALAADGSTYLTGRYGGGGSGSIRFNQLSAGAAPFNTVFLAKYDHAGRLLWLREKLGNGRALRYERTPQVAVSPAQQVYLIGLFNQSVALGPTTLTSANPTLATPYCATLDAQGNFLAARSDVLTLQEYCYDCTLSPAGNLLCTCTYQGTVQHGTQQFVSANGTTPLLLSFSAQGDFQWGQASGSAVPQGDELIRSAVVDGQGNVYTSFANQGFVVASYSAAGALRWRFSVPALLTSLAVPVPDQVLLTGLYEGTATFGATPLTSKGEVDAFLAKLAVTGVVAPPAVPSNPTALVVPNIITPNHDGRNDYFQILGLSPGAWELHVYSRWGRQVYVTADYQQDWAAPSLADGTYFYHLSQPGQAAIQGWVEVIH